MKYKVGDKVRIKSLEWYNANKNKSGIVVTYNNTFTKSMSAYCGEVLTIVSVKDDFYYTLQEDSGFWKWTKEMFDETFNNNKDMEQKFKCKDEVIYQGANQGSKWKYGIFSHYGHNCIEIVGGTLNTNYFKVLPYKGNEHLVGTTDSPEEEIKLNEGDIIICADTLDYIANGVGAICKYVSISSNGRLINVMFTEDSRSYYKYCVPYSKFNINDLEATKKEILKVENGKLVKVFN